jgi:hypothetical protein
VEKVQFGAHIAAMAYRLSVRRKRPGHRPATPFKWEIYEDDKLVKQSLEYFPSKGTAVESGIKALMRLRNLKTLEEAGIITDKQPERPGG